MKKSPILFLFCLFLSACQTNNIPFVPNTQAPLPSASPSLVPIILTPTDHFFTETPTAIPTPVHTEPAPMPPIRFAVIGDYGYAGEPLEAVSELVNSWEPDFIITTGDNNYPAGGASTIDENIGQYFHDYIYPYMGIYGEGAEINRFFPTLGNHDWIINNAQPYLDYFSLPGNERYYDFEWSFIHFFAIDSDWEEPDGNRENSIQAEWLKQGLESSTATWKIVFMHHSPYASGMRAPMLVMRWPYKDWGADMVLGGHDHHYERLLIDGFPYFVNGLGGGSRYDIGNLISGSQVAYRDNWGAMLVEATISEVHLQFINIEGDLIDSFSLTK